MKKFIVIISIWFSGFCLWCSAYYWLKKNEDPLYNAICSGDYDTTKLHFDAQPELANRPIARGLAPIHIACKHNRINIVKLLLSQGCDINARSEDSDSTFRLSKATALHIACAFSSPETVLFLLKSGASQEIKDSAGKLPIDYAVMSRRQDIIDAINQYNLSKATR